MRRQDLPWEEFGDFPTDTSHRRARRLPMFQWPGGATMVYYLSESCEDVLCGSCATQRPAREILCYGTHDEGAPVFCGRCGAALLAAYGNPFILEGADVEDLPAEWQDMDEDVRAVIASEDEDAWAMISEMSSLRWKLDRLLAPGRIVHRREERISACEDRMRNILSSWIGTKHSRAYARGQEILAAAEDLS